MDSTPVTTLEESVAAGVELEAESAVLLSSLLQQKEKASERLQERRENHFSRRNSLLPSLSRI